MSSTVRIAFVVCIVVACGRSGAPADDDGGVVDGGDVDGGARGDAGASADAGATSDAGLVPDAGTSADAGTTTDAGAMTTDAGSQSDAGSVTTDDAGSADAGVTEAGLPDASVLDAGIVDSGTSDAGTPDAGSVDAGLAQFNDEFDTAATASAWVDLYPAKHATLDINTSLAGWLTMVPVAQNFTGWYSEYEGPLFYKNITGNFVAETSLTLGTASDRTMLPMLANSYAQGGFVIRDASSAPHAQRWIMYNFGYQDIAVAREIKTTVPSAGGTTDSLSTLNLNNVSGGLNQGRLRVCRVGSTFSFYHLHPGESAWVEEVFRSTGSAPTRVFGNGIHPSRADNSLLRFDRPDLAATLQVGLYVGNYDPPAAGVRGEFDYVRFGDVSSEADCLKPL